MAYAIVFFTLPSGKSPILEFLNSCHSKLRTKILRQLKYVEEYGLNPAIPNSKKITNTPLWELRILGKNNIRVFCISLPGKRVRVLHIFKKKARKTPSRELSTALKRC